jgi:hypothetical protein
MKMYEDIIKKIDENNTKGLVEKFFNKVEGVVYINGVKSEIQSIIEEGRMNLMDDITLQVQKEKEDKIQ